MKKRDKIPWRVPLKEAHAHHPFAFRGYAYRHIEDAIKEGAIGRIPNPKDVPA